MHLNLHLMRLQSIRSSPSRMKPVTETVVTNSRIVAGYFGKEHKNVIAKITNMLADLPTPHAYFQAGVYTLPETGTQTHPCYDLTRDGFALIAMGFTGKKALRFKLDYISQFNAMEARLKQPAFPARTYRPYSDFSVPGYVDP
jgi:Rha family phage regulatory protein